MKQVLVRQGQVDVVEVPAPLVADGAVLVRVSHSCISVGTEMSGIGTGAVPLWKRALREPDSVRRAIDKVVRQGFKRAVREIQVGLSTGQPTGYSLAGTVMEVGVSVEDMQPGDRVGCAGAQCAHHAEIVCVPRNLAVRIPGDIGFPEASTVTLGAIALQGVRRAVPTLGECFVVIGLGIIGQLTAQILKANGCRVIGLDLDAGRIALAEELGLDVGMNPEVDLDVAQVARLTDGVGADGVIITAASRSDAVVSTAFQMCRKKGRVVLVGDVGLGLNRADFYKKEIDFLISSSYGPGRYDRKYEEKNVDYPIGYVRWTENRNMAAYLQLLAEGKVAVERLLGGTRRIDEAAEAYESLQAGESRPLTVLLSCPDHDNERVPVRVVPNARACPIARGLIRVAVVGAGEFATSVHLPNLGRLSGRYGIHAVCNRTGSSSVAVSRKFGAAYSTTDFREVLADDDVDLILIATRHNLHGSMIMAALEAGKHVFTEKPLSLDRGDLAKIVSFYDVGESETRPILCVGFNRRFSPHVRRIDEMMRNCTHPVIINYRMNAGYVPADHWVHSEEGGGRNRGEACHIYDLFTYLTDRKVVNVDAQSIHPSGDYYRRNDNFVTTMTFEDGSVATLTYTALGSKAYPKERMTVFCDGKVLELDDYRELVVFGSGEKGHRTDEAEKGHIQELEYLADAIQNGGDWPIPLWQQVQATEISFAVEDRIMDRRRVGSVS